MLLFYELIICLLKRLALSDVFTLDIMMLFPQNKWNRTVPPHPWSLYRNLPLVVQGLGVAYLILRDGIATKDQVFKMIGVMILVSYAFYAPVILFVQEVPMIGMLMIPKTMAYVAIAWIAFVSLFQVSSPELAFSADRAV